MISLGMDVSCMGVSGRLRVANRGVVQFGRMRARRNLMRTPSINRVTALMLQASLQLKELGKLKERLDCCYYLTSLSIDGPELHPRQRFTPTRSFRNT